MSDEPIEVSAANVQFVTGHGPNEPDPQRKVSEYCKAFSEWARAIGMAVRNGDHDDESSYHKHAEALFRMEVDIRKSNLLYRLMYRGERLRTEKCPEHDGHWSGYAWGRQCACQDYEDGGYGPDLTGWLPVKDD